MSNSIRKNFQKFNTVILMTLLLCFSINSSAGNKEVLLKKITVKKNPVLPEEAYGKVISFNFFRKSWGSNKNSLDNAKLKNCLTKGIEKYNCVVNNGLKKADAETFISIDNDRWANQDENYTHGLRISRIHDIGTFNYPGTKTWSFLHALYTPKDLSDLAEGPSVRPYAGWMAIEKSTSQKTVANNDFSKWEKNSWSLGVVGPITQGEKIQGEFHRFLNIDKFDGWSKQLPNELTLQFNNDRRFLKKVSPYVDIITGTRWSIGTIRLSARATRGIRVGKNMPDDGGWTKTNEGTVFVFGPHRGSYTPYIFIEAGADLVVRDLFLDGTLFSSSRSVNKKFATGDLLMGVSWGTARTRWALTRIEKTKTFEHQPDAPGYLSLTAAWNF